ncbi:MAG TPA: hypothetical protein VGI84_03705, partial [Pseudonocardiaceae bacterium]
MGRIPEGGLRGRRWRRSAVAVAAITVVASAGGWAAAGAGWAESGPPPLAPGLPTAHALPLPPLLGKLGPRLATSTGPVTVFVELAQPAALDVFQQQRGAGKPVPAAAQAATQARGRI